MTGDSEQGLGANKPASLIDQLRANPRLPLMLAASAAIAAIAALTLWTRAPDYGVLYSNLSNRDGGEIIASLQQMNIPYKFANGGGALMVAADKIPEARLKLAAQGLPKGGSVGFELMDNQKFGTSQFAEQVNYQRALEGELARSINSISAVESARVHLALPKPSLFVRDQKSPSASVILTLQRGRSIDEGQINAIVHLISSSVPELSAKSITVVDQAGNLLSAANSGTRGLDVSQLKYAQQIEQGYMQRIEAILAPIVGAGNVHAQVTASIDFAVVENTDEKYRPNQDAGTSAIRSQQSTESTQQGAGGGIGGVPGALTNQPGATPVAPIVAAPPLSAASAAAAGQLKNPTDLSGSVRKDTTINYEVDRSIRHSTQSGGGIKRLSVAVVVNYRGIGNAGKTAALSDIELEQINNLVKEAMGYNAERGDSLNVVNSQFLVTKTEPEIVLPIWRQPVNVAMAMDAGKYLLIGLLGLYLWFAALRPLLRLHLGITPAPAKTTKKGAAKAAAEAKANALTAQAAPLTPEQLAAEARKRDEAREMENTKYAQDIAVKEPMMVAMLIKGWMEKNE
ncbi:Flagellar M-ring protein [Polaromonas vacuolata]|uniref:Flagellar M-ring protein n=1 Tax=Polaromonas vacuolata TaxID=37448 RepID=A0A6H2H5L2_9BURK|nr:flagellar basal-body MS-ring/collar protein FliF [Polaromonas vacuolata]QJC55161.1 Flagellar M-ring protein [Polaromonas vacuolata]